MSQRSFHELSYPQAPRVKGSLPGPRSRELLHRQEELEGNAVCYPRGIPAAFVAGRGATLKDADGNLFLDFFGGAGVLNVGHCNPQVMEAVRDQTCQLTHSLDFPHPLRIKLVEILDGIAPESMRGWSRTLFGGPTGSDAVESAIKLAKLNSQGTSIISFAGGYHGMTAGALSLTSDRALKKKYLPMLPDVHFMPYSYCYRCPLGLEYPGCGTGCASYLEEALRDPHSGISDPAAVIVEPIQGEGGSIVPPPEFVERIGSITREQEIPLVVDEIQAGMGRTGAMWSCEHFEVEPDIMTISKGLGGGLPLSAIIYHRDVDRWEPGDHLGTFRGHLTGMAAGVAALEFTMNNRLPKHAGELGNHMRKFLNRNGDGFPCMGDIRGRGLMIGIEFVADPDTRKPWPEMAREVRLESYRRGLLVELGGHYRNVVRFLPPLVLTREMADRGLEIFLEALESTRSKLSS